MTQEERIYDLEKKVNELEERNSNLTEALSGTIHILYQVVIIMNNTHLNYSQEKRELIAELNRLHGLL
jgi:hypothetical protein